MLAEVELCTDRVVVLADLVDPGMGKEHIGLADQGREELHTDLLADIGAKEDMARLVAYVTCLLGKG